MSEELTTRERAGAVIERAKPYIALWENSDFQLWKERVVDARLEQWQRDVMGGKVPRELVESNILAYQMVSEMFEKFFGDMRRNDAAARRILKEEES